MSPTLDRPHCPACGATAGKCLVDLPYGEAPLTTYLAQFYAAYPGCDFTALQSARYRLEACDHCGCIYQNPAPSPEFLQEFYHRGLYGPDAPPYPSPEIEHSEHIVRELTMVVHFLSNQNARRPAVLDYGTGSGRWAFLAAASGVETHACDLSTHAFARLESAGIGCHLIDALPAARFDYINTDQVMEHVLAPADIVRRCANALRPGGILKIGVPYDPNLRAKLQQPDWLAPKHSPHSLNGVAPVEHLNHFEPRSLDLLAQNNGLKKMTVSRWSLATSDQAWTPQTLRQRFGTWLRTTLGETYRAHPAGTQTWFYHKPVTPHAR